MAFVCFRKVKFWGEKIVSDFLLIFWFEGIPGNARGLFLDMYSEVILPGCGTLWDSGN